VKKWIAAILAALVVAGYYSKEKFCQSYPTHNLCVIVTPTPEPTAVPTATPEPTPSPSPSPEPTPVATPTPLPTAPPVAQCGVRLDGQPRIDINLHASNRNIDATPKIYNADRCTAVGYVNRQTCPVCPEDCAQRGPCEEELMGGAHPIWEMRNATGNLRVELDGGWFGRLYGNGTGQVRACYPNGRACSEWLEVSL
jgi:hypothetical protein